MKMGARKARRKRLRQGTGQPAAGAPVLAPPARGCPCDARSAGPAAKLAALASRAPLRQSRRVRGTKRAARAGLHCCASRLRTGTPSGGRPAPCRVAAALSMPAPPCASACTVAAREARLLALPHTFDAARATGGSGPGPGEPRPDGVRRGPTAHADPGDVCGAEQRSVGVGARSALRSSFSRRVSERSSRSERSEFRRATPM